MTYAAIYTAATDPVFQGRCLVAAWKAAQDILAEPTNTANYGGRRGWATNILQGTARITPQQLAVQVLRNATIAGNATAAADGDLQFQVNSIITDLVSIG
jgi:hypothetical protein